MDDIAREYNFFLFFRVMIFLRNLEKKRCKDFRYFLKSFLQTFRKTLYLVPLTLPEGASGMDIEKGGF